MVGRGDPGGDDGAVGFDNHRRDFGQRSRVVNHGVAVGVNLVELAAAGAAGEKSTAFDGKQRHDVGFIAIEEGLGPARGGDAQHTASLAGSGVDRAVRRHREGPDVLLVGLGERLHRTARRDAIDPAAGDAPASSVPSAAMARAVTSGSSSRARRERVPDGPIFRIRPSGPVPR